MTKAREAFLIFELKRLSFLSKVIIQILSLMQVHEVRVLIH